jgi:hypothetical protein
MDIIGGEQDKQDSEIQITMKIVFIVYMINTYTCLFTIKLPGEIILSIALLLLVQLGWLHLCFTSLLTFKSRILK